jgi:hypothetical protein
MHPDGATDQAADEAKGGQRIAAYFFLSAGALAAGLAAAGALAAGAFFSAALAGISDKVCVFSDKVCVF